MKGVPGAAGSFQVDSDLAKHANHLGVPDHGCGIQVLVTMDEIARLRPPNVIQQAVEPLMYLVVPLVASPTILEYSFWS